MAGDGLAEKIDQVISILSSLLAPTLQMIHSLQQVQAPRLIYLAQGIGLHHNEAWLVLHAQEHLMWFGLFVKDCELGKVVQPGMNTDKIFLLIPLDVIKEVKEKCMYCKKTILLKDLRKHVQACKWEKFTISFDSDSDFEEKGRSSYIDDVAVPSCSLSKPENEEDVVQTVMVDHVMTESSNENVSFNQCNAETTIVSIIGNLIKEIDGVSFNFVVRRECVLEDTLRAVNRRTFSVRCPVTVTFMGEAGEDGGGLTREFWNLLSKDMKSSLFEGTDYCCVPRHDPLGLQSRKFYQVGSLVAMGIVQGSSGFPFLSPPVFEYLCSGEIPVHVSHEHVPSLEVKTFMNEIEKAEDNLSLRQVCTDNMELAIEAGYNQPLVTICVSDKTELLQTLGLHFTILCSKAVLDQFKEGLQSLGIMNAVVQYPVLMKPLFVGYDREPLDAEMFQSLIGTVHFSVPGSSEAVKERATYNYDVSKFSPRVRRKQL